MAEEARGSIVIAAVSGRGLARAAVDAGYIPLVADFFADLDTKELAHRAHKVEGDIGRGFEWETLAPALEHLYADAPSRPLGLVYGSGFEDRPQLLEEIATRLRLLGNDAATVAAIKDPEQFFPTLSRLGLPHPETRHDPPQDPRDWVAKRRGGSGGSHVTLANGKNQERNVYFQERVPGRSVSALFAANTNSVTVLGFSEQWTAPTRDKVWRFGGAAQPAELPHGVAEGMREIVARVAAEFRLSGLNSADFLLDGDTPRLIEINPRPGRTLDLFAGASPALMTVQINAVTRKQLPSTPPAFEAATALATAFAPQALTIPEDMDWPPWAADLPAPGERIDKERPICTLLARGESTDQARRLVEVRVRDLLTVLGVAQTPAYAEQLPAQS